MFTLDAWLDLWLNTWVVPLRAPSTVRAYRYALAHLPSELLSSPLPALEAVSLQRVINSVSASFPRQAQILFAALRAALGRAVRMQLLTRSPMVLCEMPHHTATHYAWLSTAELQRYLYTAISSPAFPVLLLMAACGLRRGEALAVRLSDFSADGSGGYILQICRQTVNGQIVSSLKSAASRRFVPVPLSIYRMITSATPASVGALVPGLSAGTLARCHARVLNAANLPHIPLHGLRHSFATSALHLGASISTIQHILGHAHYDLTASTYAHVLQSDMIQASASVAEALIS